MAADGPTHDGDRSSDLRSGSSLAPSVASKQSKKNAAPTATTAAAAVMDYYAILGINRDANLHSVQKACVASPDNCGCCGCGRCALPIRARLLWRFAAVAGRPRQAPPPPHPPEPAWHTRTAPTVPQPRCESQCTDRCTLAVRAGTATWRSSGTR